MSNSVISDIEDILLALQIKRRKYKYSFVSETRYNQKSKQLFRVYCIIKYHKEIRLLDENGEKKKKKVTVRDDQVRGNLTSLLMYLVEELKGV